MGGVHVIKKTKEELLKMTETLVEQIELFEMAALYEKAQVSFRETYEAWYEERITLDEALAAMLDNMNLCDRISKLGQTD